jgi:C1A family cysteine protease
MKWKYAPVPRTDEENAPLCETPEKKSKKHVWIIISVISSVFITLLTILVVQNFMFLSKVNHPEIQPAQYSSYKKSNITNVPQCRYIRSDLPRKVDMRRNMPPVYDQGRLGSCALNAIAGAVQFHETRIGLPMLMPSRLQMYYMFRESKGLVDIDTGCSFDDVIALVQENGFCTEKEWPYNISNFAVHPNEACEKVSHDHTITHFERICTNLMEMKKELSQGTPVLFGIQTFDNWRGLNATVPLPTSSSQSVGGHGILAVGYDDDLKHVIFRNSWGEAWGDNGYGYVPFDYFKDELAWDFVVIRSVV